MKMSKQIHDESNRRKQVKFRADAELVEQLDNQTGDRNRSDVLRELIRDRVESDESEDTPLVPPTDETLRTAYLALCEVANRSGVVRWDAGLSVLSSRLGLGKKEIEHIVIKKLHRAGYISRLSSFDQSDRAMRLNGWDE
jgi:hypothetical protein